MLKPEDMRFANLMDEFKWVMNVLDSVNSRKQLTGARNLYNCWKNKYNSFNVIELYREFEMEFMDKEENLFDIEFSKKM